MKLLMAAITSIALSACATTKAQTIDIRANDYSKDIDGIVDFLKKTGHNDILITGDRTADCVDDHSVFGVGVILKRVDKNGKPGAFSATVCQDFDNNFSIYEDRV